MGVPLTGAVVRRVLVGCGVEVCSGIPTVLGVWIEVADEVDVADRRRDGVDTDPIVGILEFVALLLVLLGVASEPKSGTLSPPDRTLNLLSLLVMSG